MQFAVVLGHSRPHFRRRAYHLVQRSGFNAREFVSARCEVVAKKASTGSVAGNVRTDIVGIRALLRVLVERAVPAGPAGQPRGAHDTPAAALAQRLRGVVVDGRSDCPAQTSAFSDAEMSLVCSGSLTTRDRLRGRVCALRRCASLRNTSEAALACARITGEVFSERPIGLRSICDVAAHQERATEPYDR